ncbi:MAG: TIGR03621 family F420-dependent LLM class oxidoreductase [Actinomycetota bacterium]
MTDHDRTHPIRFAIQVSPEPTRIAEVGAEAEAAGFDVISVADHVGPGGLAPIPTLAALAATTSTIGLGTLVCNNDMRNPVQLAWEALSIHRISGGRFELGLGAGHSGHEYTETGIPFDPPATRKARLAEAVEIIAGLVRGQPVSLDGTHYTVADAAITQNDPEEDLPPLPILVGGNGTALLTHAAEHADIIGLQGLGRTLEDGHRHDVRFSTDHLESQLATVAEAVPAGGRGPELNALVQVVEITDDRERAATEVAERVPGLTVEDALSTPYLAFGTVEELATGFLAARDRWGISYFSTRSLELAPVIARVRELDRAG